MSRVREWFEADGRAPFDFQRDAWDAYRAGDSGLLHASTGAGKTLAAWIGPLLEYEAESPDPDEAPPLRVLWITPMRALANDTAHALRAPIEALDWPWRVELRTGDTSGTLKRKQLQRLPTTLITTPESLSLLLSHPGADARFGSLRAVVVDEWHELLGSKRGVQTELGLARLRTIAPQMRTWGLSATLGNLDEAMSALLGPQRASTGRLVRGRMTKAVRVDTVRPATMDRFPWAGHLGLKLLPQVIDVVEQAGTTLLFTNTRSQAELWFHALVTAAPAWVDQLAIHHGSLDREVREKVERMLDAGELRCVVCTSSLDLGVDFLPVEQVVQVGSPKGIARMLQRAGRSGHQPGAESRIVGVPTNAMELVEFSAAREAGLRALRADGDDRGLEARRPVDRPLDVLAQHLVTIAMGDGFDETRLRDEVRTTHAYAALSDEEWSWVMDFVVRGGSSLKAYDQFARVVRNDDRWRVESKTIARTHRLSIGTITGDASMKVKFIKGATLGTIEETFIGRLRKGDQFFFAGRRLEFVRSRGLTAYVRRATKKAKGAVPRWGGGRSPLSTKLATGVRARLDEARRGIYADEEMALVRPILELQQRWSRIPAADETMIERVHDRRGWHVFIYTFAGRLANEGLAALFGKRITDRRACSVMMNGNDYGVELTSSDPLDLGESAWREVLSTAGLLDDLLACVNDTELARRRFRAIAQIAGLIHPGYPGDGKSTRHLQASSNLFFDVFLDFDPGNRLLDQARREVLERELEFTRLEDVLARIEAERLVLIEPARISPLSFPLWAESIRTQQTSSESWSERIERMAASLEAAADREAEEKETASHVGPAR